MILIISSEEDDHAQAVLKCLAELNTPAKLLNLAHFPRQTQLAINFSSVFSAEGSTLTDPNGDVALSGCRVVWWRRPQLLTLHPEISDHAQRTFAYNECFSALSGLWLSFNPFWVNHPTRDEEASRKAYQLKIASEIGLKIPATLITNHPEKARRFAHHYGIARTIYKSFSATEQAWRETRVLKPEEMALLDSVRYAPVIFQEYVPAQLDLRITVIGAEVFAAAIYSQDTDYKVDYRMEMHKARIEAFDLPKEITVKLQNLMQRLGLIYGAIDMRLTPDGRFVFLEINPSGQWLFMEERTNLPITKKFAQMLAEQNTLQN